jgi:peptidoglycan/xylan/chitin deacetylase (PgdA/CDA1 family)
VSVKLKVFPTLISLFVIAACAGQPSVTSTSPSPTAAATNEETAVIARTETATSEPTPAATSEPPPASFESDVLRAGILPVRYIEDSCQYLDKRWDPALSTPGTVVATVMYHSILPGSSEPTTPEQINANTFYAIIELAERLGFETITTQEYLAFLNANAKIPARSMLLILDDRRPGTAAEYFLPVNERNGWTTTLAWIIGDSDQRDGELAGETLWDWIERIYETGFFDVQSHGLNHIYLNESMSEDVVREEIEGSIPILIEHFGQRPVAYIWPGGNYTKLGVEIAREAGFELGFTVHSRGPVMFNWIPQGEQEMELGDPLMTLPRFWDSAALLNLGQTAEIGDTAREFARANYQAEAAWFAANCGGALPPLDAVLR